MREPEATQELVPAPASSNAMRVGAVLDGRYRIDGLLGEGGMGAVWRATQLSLQRQVAIKLLRAPDPAQHARLQREALALAALQHPAIVAVHDFGETHGQEPYLVMELVRGESLEARLSRVGAIGAREAVELLLPLLDGLAYAHERGVVHRDLKPSNVLIAAGDDGPEPKLVDFGIALLTTNPAARLTGAMVVGTPVYMAPEQLRGQPLDPRVDVWGAATLLYEMIAGRPPFAGDQLMRVITRVVDEPPSFPRRAADLDGRLWSILMGALRKDPQSRTSSIATLRVALAGWLETALSSRASEAESGRRIAATAPTVPPPPDSKAADSPQGDSMDALIRARLGGG